MASIQKKEFLSEVDRELLSASQS